VRASRLVVLEVLGLGAPLGEAVQAVAARGILGEAVQRVVVRLSEAAALVRAASLHAAAVCAGQGGEGAGKGQGKGASEAPGEG